MIIETTRIDRIKDPTIYNDVGPYKAMNLP